MVIKQRNIEPNRPGPAERVPEQHPRTAHRPLPQAVRAPDRVPPAGTSRPERTDAANGATLHAEVRAELTPEQIAELRRRIQEGAYTSPEVLDEVARRMLERGDV
jgi:hypothetical protein